MLLWLLACTDPRLELESFELASKRPAIEDTYVINVYRGDGVQPDDFGWRVLVALDGKDGPHLRHLASATLDATEAGDLPPTLVVGIGYPGRTGRSRDYTPTPVDGVDGSGEATAFFDFVANDVVAEVDDRWPTAAGPYARGLVGHSLGGLGSFVGTLQHPDVFGNLLAASPSLLWDDQVAFDLEADYAETHDDLDAAVFLSVGAREGLGADTVVDAMADRLRSRDWPGLDLGQHLVPGKGHMGSRSESYEVGLAHLFQRDPEDTP